MTNATSQLDGLNRVIRRTDRDWKNAVTKDTKYNFDDSSDTPVSVSNAASGALETSYVRDSEGLLAVREDGVTKHQFVSGHGDVVQVADESGSTSYPAPRAYDEFGNSSGGATPYGFTGRWQRETSPGTGTVRMGVRLYDPSSRALPIEGPARGRKLLGL